MVEGGTSTPPAAPVGVTATAGNSQVSVSWTTNGASYYNVYEGTASGGEGTVPVVTGISGPPWVASGLSNGLPYFFEVTTVDDNGESTPSIEVTATPTALLPAPADPTATAGNTQATLTWYAVVFADSYSVWRGTASGGPYTLAANTASTTLTDVGLWNGTTYYYVVTADDAAGPSAYSAEASVTPVADQAAAPAITATEPAQNGGTPVTVPSGSRFNGTLTVTLSCVTPGMTVFYTTDGSDPTNAANAARQTYSAPLTLFNRGCEIVHMSKGQEHC